MRYSGLRVIREALNGQKGWKPAWRNPEPKPNYDIIVIGGGGHGLATAHYLATKYGEKSIAVVEKGWIGSGNAGRNTTIVRGDYTLPPNTRFYDHSVGLWEKMERELNFNVMHSQRGLLFVHHNDSERDDHYRKTNIMRMQGTDGEILGPEQVRKMYPSMNFDGRFPITGAYLHRRGGTARHDAVVWGYARSADRRGVDILQNCEVMGFRIEQGKVLGIETTRGFIGARKVGVSVAGNTSRVMDMAGIRTPIESHVLQAFVSEGLKPIIPGQVNYGAGHFYISQSDKGGLVMGGDLDQYNSCAQRGNLPVFESVIEAAVTLFPMLSRARLLRAWGGLQDMSMDGHAVIDETPIKGLYLNGGWCYGGFKATPAAGECFAHLLSTEQPHELAKPYRLDRFRTGYLLDEKGQGPNPNRQ
ncbi:sarcosine oxidase subunit beta family protein [Shimia abyssi]|uniref:Sarcosine oxidase subunit beta n=1 Tax=Shimia abyssi TaxID=1662395 RepID=A0A2P8FH89_9RHOB|nr:sarcosine oxidase subunit beta family protein [Shimia abyssi]PSL21075.1 sarcosine oxidase subunit beta [Shimia abyssi]